MCVEYETLMAIGVFFAVVPRFRWSNFSFYRVLILYCVVHISHSYFPVFLMSFNFYLPTSCSFSHSASLC